MPRWTSSFSPDLSNLRYYLIKGNVYSSWVIQQACWEKLYKQLDAKFPNQRSDISRQLATHLDQHRDAEAVVLDEAADS